MTIKEMHDLLATIMVGTNPIPVGYDHFEQYPDKKVVPPFILYRNVETPTLKADDKVHYQNNNYEIDLITEVKRDGVLETQLETLLNDNFLPYDKEIDYINEERIFQVRFFI